MIRSILIVFLTLGLLMCARAEEVSVSAAISLKETLEAVRQQYESSSPDRLKFTFGASGQLEAQIKNGAPIDLFLSAARMQVDDLQKAGRAINESISVIAENELVLIVPAKAKSPPVSFAELPRVQRLAMGEPKTVPAGEYARQTLDHLGLTEKLKGKLIYGLNVRQVLQYVQSGEVDAGLVYITDAKQAGQRVKVVATAESQWHQPIEYVSAVVRDAKHADAARKFLDYLKTEPAREVFAANGFTNPSTQPTTAPAK